MSWIREWFVKQWRPIEQTDKTREFQVGGVIEQPEEDEFERFMREATEREAKRIARDRRILEAWQKPDSVKLTKVGFDFRDGAAQEYFADDDNVQELRKIFDKPVSTFYLFQSGSSGPTRIQSRNEMVVAVAEFPERYVLFEGKPTLVPEG